MVRLALHRSYAGILVEEPIVDFVGFAGAARVRDLVVRIVLLGEVLEDGAGFEDADLLAVGEGVGDGGDAAVGVDFEEPGFFLGVFGDVDFVGFVGEARRIISFLSFAATTNREVRVDIKRRR